MVAKFSACCLRASSTTSPAPGAIHWRRLPPISMLNSGPHESFDAAQMSAADHAALRARLLALFPVGLPRDWGSGCAGDFGERIVRGEEALPEAGAGRAVVDGAADLEQPVGTAPRPAHLLRFVHATIDEEVGCSLGQRRANPQSGPVPLAVVDQPVALPDEVAVQRLQRSPQLARGRDRKSTRLNSSHTVIS